jgi:ribosomal protein L16 Arg81 hydroxylase
MILFCFILKFKAQCCEKDHQIKALDADFKNLRDQHRHLLKLSRDQHLGDREQLTKQVEELKEIIREQDVRIQV